MQPAHYTSLLPEVFRHKTTRVRILQPQAILLDFHGTISERHWEDRVIFPYVKRVVSEYLRENWTNETIQRCLPSLKEESFEQRFRYKYEDAPIIEDITTGVEEPEALHLIEQVGDFLVWQMTTKRETKETQTIERLIWHDGFRRKQILTPLYDDVMPCVKSWVEKYNCSVYVISSVDNETLKLLFESTDKGNLHQYMAGYLSSKKAGDKIIVETYKQFYEKILQSAKPKQSPKSKSSPKEPKSDQPNLHAKSSSTSLNSSKSPPSASHINENLPKTILFLTDSGQEAKAASQVAGGAAFECLLINRPGNKRIRTYYLSQFQYVDRFDDIEFVQ